MSLTKHQWKYVGLLVLPTWLGATCIGLASPGPQESKPAEPPEVKLERVLPRSPQEAMQSFDVAPGFGVELVASEPMVVDPIAAIFDDHGRMVVIEMIDYSEEDQARLGRVKRLKRPRWRRRDGQGGSSCRSTFVANRLGARRL